MEHATDRWTLPDWPKTLEWCQMRNSQGIRCIIDVLGEYATTIEAAESAKVAYKECIKQIHENDLAASISVKLSSLGSMFDAEQCQKNVVSLANEARSREVGFEIDMEGSQMVDLTIQITKACANNGVITTMALQAYLKRSLDDLDELRCQDNLRIRLVKGAYLGDNVDPRMTSEGYKLLIEALTFLRRPYCIATHDPELLNWMKSKGIIDTTKTEFGFLKGLADKTKIAFAENGLIVSEYVPFGKMSGPYIARRLKYLHDLEVSHKYPAP
jgi:proline dehydrogenase